MVMDRMEQRTKTTAITSPTEALNTWWIGTFGTLTSLSFSTGRSTEGEAGYDFAVTVARVMDARLFARLPDGWREFAKWAVSNGYRTDNYPVWLVTPDRLFAMRAGELLRVPPNMRGRGLLVMLRRFVDDYLSQEPLPLPPAKWYLELD